YAQSPYARKIENTLLLKSVAYQQVNVSSVLPRPEIKDALGIAYRRIPILAIGRDVYCDTSMISVALERRFPPSAGYGTIFPKTRQSGHVDTGLARSLAQLTENAIFSLAAALLPWDQFPESFLRDRTNLSAAPIDPKAIVASRERTLSTLSCQLQLLEQQMSDGREWLLNTEEPGLVDISYHFIISWVRPFPAAKGLNLTERFPKITAWLERFSTVLKQKKQQLLTTKVMNGDEAAASIVSSTYEPLDAIGFNEQEATRLGVKQDEVVLIAPTDTGTKHPTTGKLVALNLLEMVIEIAAPKGNIRCHFPRLYFAIRPAGRSRL
ncbi:hypothetical protein M378DRAFT_87284, partial [Amanita muscaria Koide BX008]